MRYCIISKDVKLGKDVKIYSFVNLYVCEIGDRTKIGAFVEIQKGVRIGKDCKISSHTFICEGVTIEDQIFIGHNVTFINDKYPKATNDDGSCNYPGQYTDAILSNVTFGSVGCGGHPSQPSLDFIPYYTISYTVSNTGNLPAESSEMVY